MKFGRLALVTGVLLLAAVMFAGCSRNNPVETVTENSAMYTLAGVTTDGQLMVKVQTCDQLRQRFTICDSPDTVVANQNCEMVRVQYGVEEPAEFGDIHPGDSVQVFRQRQQNNYIYAYKLRIMYQEPKGYQMAARVETAERNRFMITFSDKPDTAIALQNCEVSRKCQSFQFNLGFDGIKPGDSVQLYGQKNQDGYFYAHHIQICNDDPGGRWDIAFKDTIATIDYEAGTFTVNNRSELITIDENTVVKAITVVSHEPEDPSGDDKSAGGAALGDGAGGQWGQTYEETLLAFTDLAVGDVVTVHALFVDETTLLAACITLADCTNLNQKCVLLTAPIATLDLDTRIITFEGYDWNGWVCNGAQLTGLDGEELTLADFAVGEWVSIKGFPETETDLRISQMTKVATP